MTKICVASEGKNLMENYLNFNLEISAATAHYDAVEMWRRKSRPSRWRSSNKYRLSFFNRRLPQRCCPDCERFPLTTG